MVTKADAAQAKKEEDSALCRKIAKAIAQSRGEPDAEGMADAAQEAFDEDDEE